MIKNLVLILILILGGCMNPPYNYKPEPLPDIEDIEIMGQEANVLSTLSPTALGSSIGQYTTRMNSIDKQHLAQIFEKQQSGLTKRWHNDETDIVYAITPTRTHQYTDGSICREYVVELLFGNDIKEFYGRACRQKDGSWVVVN